MDWFYDLKERFFPTAPIGVASPEAVAQANKTKLMSLALFMFIWVTCGTDIKRFFRKIF